MFGQSITNLNNHCIMRSIAGGIVLGSEKKHCYVHSARSRWITTKPLTQTQGSPTRSYVGSPTCARQLFPAYRDSLAWLRIDKGSQRVKRCAFDNYNATFTLIVSNIHSKYGINRLFN